MRPTEGAKVGRVKVFMREGLSQGFFLRVPYRFHWVFLFLFQQRYLPDTPVFAIFFWSPLSSTYFL